MYKIYVTGVKNKVNFFRIFRKKYGTSITDLSNIIRNLPHQLTPECGLTWEGYGNYDQYLVVDELFDVEEKEEIVAAFKNIATLATDYIQTDYDTQIKVNEVWKQAHEKALAWYDGLTDEEKIHVDILRENSGGVS